MAPARLWPSLKGAELDKAGARLRLCNIFVVGQVTLSLVLVIAAGLFGGLGPTPPARRPASALRTWT